MKTRSQTRRSLRESDSVGYIILSYIFLCSYTPINRARRDPPPVVADIVRFQMSRIPEKLQSTPSIYPKIFNYITLVSMNIPRYRSREFALFRERNICICIFPLETNSGIVVSSIHSRLAARWSIPVAE